jgi:hypothetical protein
MSGIHKPKSLFFPLLLIVVGVLIFLINIGKIQDSTWDNLWVYWPVILIIGGLDGLYKRDGWIGPLAFIGLGTVLLLGNLHYISAGGFDLLLRLWPVLLVAVGLDIAFGHRVSLWSTIIRIALGIGLIVAILWLATASPFGPGMKVVPFTQSLDSATQSNITFSVAAGELKLAGGADKASLVSGSGGIPNGINLDYQYIKTTDNKSTLTLEGNNITFLPTTASSQPWDFKLTSAIPVNLTTELAVGQLDLNLAEVKVTDLHSQLAIGKMIVTLPAGQDINVTIENAIGQVVIRVPKGSHLEITADTGIVATHLPVGYTKNNDVIRAPGTGSNNITLKIDLAIGDLVIEEY